MFGAIDNFLSSILGFVIQLFLWLLGVIASLIVYPIQALLVTAFPSLGAFLSTVSGYFTNELFPMISFIKEIFLGITCFPRSLWNIIIGILIFRIGVVPSIRFIKTVLNIIKIKNGDVNLK